jgi:hypothetical protein
MTNPATPSTPAVDLEGLHKLFHDAYLQTNPDCAILLRWLKQAATGQKYDQKYKVGLDAAFDLLVMPTITKNALQKAEEAIDKEHQHWLQLTGPARGLPDDIGDQLRRNTIKACEEVLETIDQHEWRESTIMDMSRLFSRYVQEASTTLFGNVWTAIEPMFVELCKKHGLDPESHFTAFKNEWEKTVFNEQTRNSLHYVTGIAHHMFDIAAGTVPFPAPPPNPRNQASAA